MDDINQSLSKELISGTGRLLFLPVLFKGYYGTVQVAAIQFMKRFCDEYESGRWEFYKVGDNSGFICPEFEGNFYFEMSGNYFNGSVSPEAAGIIVTLFVMQYCFDTAWRSMEYEICNHFRTAMDTLKDYAATTDESRLIFRAID